MAGALPLDEAQARLLELAQPLPPENVPVDEALGRCLAAPLVARRTQPAADLSAMDGFALGPSSGEGPWAIVGESAAGHPLGRRLCPGEAARISTGAIVPEGADRMLLQEDALREGPSLRCSGALPPAGRHIRRQGFDFRAGDALAATGTLATPALVALALTAGHATIPVRRLPAMAIIDSGDELASDPTACAAHQIPASNAAMLAALAQPLTGSIRTMGPLPDRIEALASAMDGAAEADLVVTSGGASVGDHDLVRPALEKVGAEIAFWRVAMKPGKPIMVARRGKQLILGLPGNPVSCYVTAFLFMLPVLRAMAGASRCLPTRVLLPVAEDLGAGGKRMEFLRAAWDGADLRPLGEQDSSGSRALAQANALLIRPVDAAPVPKGTLVPAYLLANGGIA